jgi:hypothetical protein
MEAVVSLTITLTWELNNDREQEARLKEFMEAKTNEFFSIVKPDLVKTDWSI